MSPKSHCKPIIKWVGGKRQLINEIKEYMPKEFGRYFEPFVGGGALFFELGLEGSFINDYNEELTNLYRVIKSKPDKLIDDLKKHINSSKYYYEIRALDRNREAFAQLSDIQRASRFIYLNKSGFNGLYRVNKKGEYNVPYGRYKNPKYLDEENIKSVSRLLQSTTITNGDFEIIKDHIKAKDFIYLDPPYAPLSKSSNFTSYTDKGFDNDMQFRLKELCDYIDSIGAYFMLSNSYASFVLDLYSSYDIKIVKANRAINCQASSRGKISEVLVINY